jgi:electron transport complex protein RnfG
MASFHPPALVSKTLIALTLATAPVSAATISGLAALLTLSEASAATVYWELPALLTSFFPGADRVSFAKVALSQQERAALSRKLGRPLRSDWTIFIATKAGQVTGYAVVDEVRGMHEPITYATRFTPAGAISRMEVMRYREAYGGEVREQRFLSQFNGKTAASPMRAGSDITAISGATISSYAVTRGAEETAALLGLLLQQRPSALLHAAK